LRAERIEVYIVNEVVLTCISVLVGFSSKIVSSVVGFGQDIFRQCETGKRYKQIFKHGGRLVHETATYRCHDTRGCVRQF